MAKPVLNGKPQELFNGRYWQRTVELFEADETPLELALTDVVRCRISAGSKDGPTDDSTPYVTASSAEATDNGSTITVDDLGDDSTTDDPATVTIQIDPDDATLVPVDDEDTGVTWLEITVARAAETTKEYVCHRCVLKVKGSAT